MNGSEVMSRDVVATAIAAPIDWGRLEELVCAVLVADDFPSLRKVGGIGDLGVDALDESFFDGNRKINTVVQVTSARAQRAKVKNTIAKLRKNGLEPKMLLFVTRHPVSSAIRVAIIEEAAEEDVTVEIRDDQYLITQLSKPGSTIFPRFFGTAQQQLDALLTSPDPLQIANNRLRHALLASLGAFVLSPHARLARNTLFDKTVLAGLASLGGPATREQLLSAVRSLVPEETVDTGRLDPTITRLLHEGFCVASGERLECSAKTISNFTAAGQAAQRGFQALLDYIIANCKRYRALDDAQVGYVERNVRRAILQLLRSAGPLDDSESLSEASDAADSAAIKSVICKDLPPDVGTAALTAFSSFAKDKDNASLLAPLIRSYAAMAIRNLDPVGRRWQQAVLERSCVALDTDAVLNLMIEELPEHNAILSALRGLRAHGVEILLPIHVFEEAIGHISRAGKTFRRFSDSLSRMPEEAVDAKVWHAVVRGYFYGTRSGSFAGTPDSYMKKYYDADRQLAYSEHVLARRLELRKVDLAEPSNVTDPLCFELGNEVLAHREASRLKAQFRDADEMASRVWNDVRMALNLAEKMKETVDAQSRGYLATEDRAFRIIEKCPGWGERPSIRIATRALPELTNFICGTNLSDDEAIRLLFDPVSIAAADQMAPEIAILASIGVDLKDTPLDRLEWDLKQKLRSQIDTLTSTFTDEVTGEQGEQEATTASAFAAFNTAKAAMEAGYPLVAPVANLVGVFEEAVTSAEAERERNRILTGQLKALAEAALESTSKKGRRKVNEALRELGIELDLSDEPDE